MLASYNPPSPTKILAKACYHNMCKLNIAMWTINLALVNPSKLCKDKVDVGLSQWSHVVGSCFGELLLTSEEASFDNLNAYIILSTAWPFHSIAWPATQCCSNEHAVYDFRHSRFWHRHKKLWCCRGSRLRELTDTTDSELVRNNTQLLMMLKRQDIATSCRLLLSAPISTRNHSLSLSKQDIRHRRRNQGG